MYKAGNSVMMMPQIGVVERVTTTWPRSCGQGLSARYVGLPLSRVS